MTPIFNKDDPSVVSNYRPISLLSAVGKVLEKVVHKHLFNYIRDHEILSALQSGIIPVDSTVNQLVAIYNAFCKSIGEGKEVCAVFCDISKAFDRVWHIGLLFKLESIGVSDSLLLWFKSYLADRKQRVVLAGAVTTWKYIKAGVPQGSILGPLLFLIYINDIVEDIHSSIRLFADDTFLYIIVDNPQQAANILNADKQNKPIHPPLNVAQLNIDEVTSHKHLGLIFSEDGSWHEHIDHVKAKSWFSLNIMRKLKFQLDRKSLEIIFTSYIRPLLKYSNVVWDNCIQYESKYLEKTQNKDWRHKINITTIYLH